MIENILGRPSVGTWFVLDARRVETVGELLENVGQLRVSAHVSVTSRSPQGTVISTTQCAVQKLEPSFPVGLLLGGHLRLDIILLLDPVEDFESSIETDNALCELLPRLVREIVVLQPTEELLALLPERYHELTMRFPWRIGSSEFHDPAAEENLLAPDRRPIRDPGPDRCGITLDSFEQPFAFVGPHTRTIVRWAQNNYRRGSADDPKTAFAVLPEGSAMAPCDRCGATTNMPYRCRYCGGTFCGEHRLPENHGCPGLEDWGDPSGVFDAGFDDNIVETPVNKREPSRLERLGIDTGPGGPLGYFRGNMSFVFLAVMWVVFLLQQIVIATLGVEAHDTVFVLRTEEILHVWTWFTSVFSHNPGGLLHIVFNSIVLYFFGPIVERKVGSKAFAVLFIGAGVVAGLSQVGIGLITEPGGVLGASGAILAVMGVLTVLNPNLRVLLFFIVPMPLWLLTLGFAGVSVFVMLGAGPGAGNIAHLAHLIGLVIGLLYGEKLRREGVSAPRELHLGGGGPGQGPPRRRP